MKKLFLSIAAVATLFATSCVQTELEDAKVVAGETSVVTLAISGPQTRAIADGTQATELKYAIFDAQWNHLSSVEGVQLVDRKTTLQVELVNGMTYNLVFWAQAPSADCYDVNLTVPSVTVDYAGAANDEKRDAFFGNLEIEVEGATTVGVELTRPFAQINFATSDFATAVAAGFTAEKSSFTVAGMPNVLSLRDGSVSATSTQVTTFESANIISESLYLNSDVDEQNPYKWLAMNYVLAGAESALTECKIVVSGTKADGKSHSIEVSYPQAPFKRNYRTNLVGKLLTSTQGIEVEVVPGIDGVTEEFTLVNSAATLQAAIDAAGAVPTTIVLSHDLVLGPGSVIMDGALSRTAVNQDITIDLNGKTITANIPDVTSNAAIFSVKKGQKLTIQGKGTINCEFNKATNCSALLFNNEAGELVINGGTYTMDAPASWQECLNPLFVDTNTTLGAATTTINGGTFTWTRNLFRNFSNNSSVVAKLVINGGTFNGAADNTGCIWNQKPSASIPAGAGVVEIHGGVFNNMEIWSGWTLAESVVFDTEDYFLGAEEQDSGEWGAVILGPTEVSTWAEFTQALADGAKIIKLTEDITSTSNYSLQKNVTIDLNGKSITAPMFYVFSTATIKNGTINGKMYARTGCKATLEGLTFSGTISDNLSTEGHLAIQGGCDVYAKNCVFDPTAVGGSNTRPLSIEGSSSGTRKFENCDFKKQWVYKRQIYVNPMSGTTTLEFKDCTYGRAANIMFAATYPLTNLKMSGCNMTEPTLEIQRAKSAVTEADWDYLRSLIANNSFTRIRIYYAGSNEYFE